MRKRECPNCAVELPEGGEHCPICGYEFPQSGGKRKLITWVAIILIILFLIPLVSFLIHILK